MHRPKRPPKPPTSGKIQFFSFQHNRNRRKDRGGDGKLTPFWCETLYEDELTNCMYLTRCVAGAFGNSSETPSGVGHIKFYGENNPLEAKTLSKAKFCIAATEQKDTLYVCVRGSTNFDDWKTNLKTGLVKAFKGCKGRVHAGFLERSLSMPYETLLEYIKAGMRVIFTGFSLGSAVAKLLCCRVLAELDILNATGLDDGKHAEEWAQQLKFIGFGGPLVGNKAFCEYVNDHYIPGGRKKVLWKNLFHNFVYESDPVCCVLNTFLKNYSPLGKYYFLTSARKMVRLIDRSKIIQHLNLLKKPKGSLSSSLKIGQVVEDHDMCLYLTSIDTSKFQKKCDPYLIKLRRAVSSVMSWCLSIDKTIEKQRYKGFLDIGLVVAPMVSAEARYDHTSDDGGVYHFVLSGNVDIIQSVEVVSSMKSYELEIVERTERKLYLKWKKERTRDKVFDLMIRSVLNKNGFKRVATMPDTQENPVWVVLQNSLFLALMMATEPDCKDIYDVLKKTLIELEKMTSKGEELLSDMGLKGVNQSRKELEVCARLCSYLALEEDDFDSNDFSEICKDPYNYIQKAKYLEKYSDEKKKSKLYEVVQILYEETTQGGELLSPSVSMNGQSNIQRGVLTDDEKSEIRRMFRDMTLRQLFEDWERPLLKKTRTSEDSFVKNQRKEDLQVTQSFINGLAPLFRCAITLSSARFGEVKNFGQRLYLYVLKVLKSLGLKQMAEFEGDYIKKVIMLGNAFRIKTSGSLIDVEKQIFEKVNKRGCPTNVKQVQSKYKTELKRLGISGTLLLTDTPMVNGFSLFCKFVSKIHTLRSTIRKAKLLYVVGPQNCGKSSFLQKVWNFQEATARLKTTEPSLYKIADKKEKIFLIDFPAATDVDNKKRLMQNIAFYSGNAFLVLLEAMNANSEESVNFVHRLFYEYNATVKIALNHADALLQGIRDNGEKSTPIVQKTFKNRVEFLTGELIDGVGLQMTKNDLFLTTKCERCEMPHLEKYGFFFEKKVSKASSVPNLPNTKRLGQDINIRKMKILLGNHLWLIANLLISDIVRKMFKDQHKRKSDQINEIVGKCVNMMVLYKDDDTEDENGEVKDETVDEFESFL